MILSFDLQHFTCPLIIRSQNVLPERTCTFLTTHSIFFYPVVIPEISDS